MKKVLRAMLVRLGDPSYVDHHCAHFRRAGFTAKPAGRHTLEVGRPDASGWLSLCGTSR